MKNLRITEQDRFRALLRTAGFKATPARMRLLRILERAHEPLSVEKITKRLGSLAPDMATIYRSLRNLHAAGILRHVDFKHRHAHYEINDPKDHHHFTCTNCGRIENFENCDLSKLIARALKKTNSFSKVTEHSLELFGLCFKCARK